MKSRFLAVYDYGQGGVWLFIYANSVSGIRAKYPELTVVESFPDWLKGDYLQKIESNYSFDIDELPSGWLEILVNQRKISDRKKQTKKL